MVQHRDADRVVQPEPPLGQGPTTDVRVVDAGYFSTMGIPLLRGRTFTDNELREAKHVLLINEALARQHFPNQGCDDVCEYLVVARDCVAACVLSAGETGDAN